jgi:hypothetical protein
MTRRVRASVSIALAALLCSVTPTPVTAQNDKARTSVNNKGSGNRTNNNRTTNDARTRDVNRNTNINRNLDIDRDVDIDIDVDHHYHGCCYNRGVGVGAAIVTAAVVGSIIYSLPPSCTIVIVNGFTYQQCGSVWYQPRFVGTTTSYVVVIAPR